VTVPTKPLTLVSVIVVVPEEPEPMFRELGLELMPKSLEAGGLIVTVTVAIWDRVPLVPVTVTV
jgi:hypothetical protein